MMRLLILGSWIVGTVSTVAWASQDTVINGKDLIALFMMSVVIVMMVGTRTPR